MRRQFVSRGLRSCAAAVPLAAVTAARPFSDFFKNARDMLDQERARQAEDASGTPGSFDDEMPNSLADPRSCPRSVLFVPCSNTKALRKAAGLDADCFILDLEDSVAPNKKEVARENLIEVLRGGDLAGKRLVVRVNSPREAPHLGFPDLDAVGGLAEFVEGVGIPKTTIRDFELIETSIHPEHSLWAFFETPRSVLEADAVLRDGHYRVACMGLNDFCNEMDIPLKLTSATAMSGSTPAFGGVPRRWPLHTAMSTVAMAAKANGVYAIDGVFNDHRDTDGLKAELLEAQMLGFSGKTLIHPSQIGPTNSAYTPSDEEVAWGKKVIDAVAAADGGVAVVDGKMVEELHAKQAARIVQRWSAAHQQLPSGSDNQAKKVGDAGADGTGVVDPVNLDELDRAASDQSGGMKLSPEEAAKAERRRKAFGKA